MSIEKCFESIKSNYGQIWLKNGTLQYMAPGNSELDEALEILGGDKVEVLAYLANAVGDDMRDNSAGDYWKKKLEGNTKLLSLPFDYKRTVENRAIYNVKSYELSDLLGVIKMCQAAPETVLFAALQSLLFRYSGDAEIYTGYLSGINSLVRSISIIFSYFNDGLTFEQLCEQLREEILAADANRVLDLETLYAEITDKKTEGFHPFYQVKFSYNTFNNVMLDGLETSLFSDRDNAFRADLFFSVIQNGEELKLYVFYNTSLFKEATINRLSRHFRNLLRGGLTQGNTPLVNLPILDDAEMEMITVAWNSNNRQFKDTALLHLQFEEQVRKNPSKTAVIYQDEILTYEELNVRVNQLAHRLINEGVGFETPVGVFTERSLATLIALLAILKTGGAYCPLDIAYPLSHLEYIIEQTGLPVVLTGKSFKDKINISGLKLIDLDEEKDKIAQEDVTNPLNQANADSLAFIFYTSGSTGKPKGVLHKHKMEINYLNWYWANHPFTENDVCCQRTNVNFIPSLHGFLCGLLQGVPTVIMPDKIVKDPVLFMDSLAKHKITRLRVVPSFLKLILNFGFDIKAKIPALKWWITAGEPLSPELYRSFRKKIPDALILNEYGTTETNGILFFNSETMHHDEMDSIPIGKPIHNIQIYLLDRHKQVVPIGVPGVIHAGGICVSPGYLKQPALTGNVFFDNPFGHTAGDKLYDTGDYACYQPDGSIKYLGRKDNQIKIRGIRLELTQIEIELAKNPDITEVAACVVKNATGDAGLAGFFVLKEGVKTGSRELSGYYRKILPDYMIPAFINIIDKMPRTPNGKLDRKSLPDLFQKIREERKQSMAGHGIGISGDYLDSIICYIIDTIADMMVVNPDDIDVEEPFLDLGIDSASIIGFISIVNKKFGLELSPSVLFEHSTILDLANFITSRKQARVK